LLVESDFASQLAVEDIFDSGVLHARMAGSFVYARTPVIGPEDADDSQIAPLKGNLGPTASDGPTHGDSVSSSGSQSLHNITMWGTIALLVKNPVFMFVSLGLSGLYFVVTGIQFWGTSFLITVLSGNEQEVRLLFMATAATAPVAGVVFGGRYNDKLGGYQGASGARRTLRNCLMFGMLGCIMALMAAYFHRLYTVVALLWGLLFCGGAVLPSATGVMISSVPRLIRSFASSFAVTLFNLLGYMLSPVISGYVMHATNSFTWGFRLVLAWSGISVILLALAYLSTRGPAPLVSAAGLPPVNVTYKSVDARRA